MFEAVFKLLSLMYYWFQWTINILSKVVSYATFEYILRDPIKWFTNNPDWNAFKLNWNKKSTIKFYKS